MKAMRAPMKIHSCSDFLARSWSVVVVVEPAEVVVEVLRNCPRERLMKGARDSRDETWKSAPACRLANSKPDQLESVLLEPRIDWLKEKSPH
jgi:hypothetical protein